MGSRKITTHKNMNRRSNGPELIEPQKSRQQDNNKEKRDHPYVRWERRE